MVSLKVCACNIPAILRVLKAHAATYYENGNISVNGVIFLKDQWLVQTDKGVKVEDTNQRWDGNHPNR